jgi:hypothetical protein
VAHPQIAAFARSADGGERPRRVIEGQATLLGRTMHAIDYGETHDEIILPQPFSQAILTFRGSASGEEPPIRVIQGPSTQLAYPDRLAVDWVHGEIFVAEGDKILVFPRTGHGDVRPIRVLQGPATGISPAGWGVAYTQHALAVDPVSDILVVANNRGRGNQRAVDLLLFRRTDQGNAKPQAVISGARTGLSQTRNIRVHAPGGWIVVANDGLQIDEFGDQATASASFVGVWNIRDRGNVPPRWTIGGPHGMLRKPRGVALNPVERTLMVSDKDLNAVLTYSFPELFERHSAD